MTKNQLTWASALFRLFIEVRINADDPRAENLRRADIVGLFCSACYVTVGGFLYLGSSMMSELILVSSSSTFAAFD